MPRGWVYVITNPAMPDLVKIGYSLKDPLIRAKQLNHTGSPHPYVVSYDALVTEPRQLEKEIHLKLVEQCEGKEWFRLTVQDAVRQIREVASDGILLESGCITSEPISEAANKPDETDEPEREPEPDKPLRLCEYTGCNLEPEREHGGRMYCLWHAREVRNPKHAEAIRRLREEQLG